MNLSEASGLIGLRVLFLGRGVYDYLEATITEGLMRNRAEVFGIHKANYIEQLATLPLDISTYDIVFTNKENRRKLPAGGGGSLPPVIFVDGRDDPFINPIGLIRSRMYLKRELLRVPFRPKSLRQMGFGVETRYVSNAAVPVWENRKIDIFCGMSTETNKSRLHYLKLIRSIGSRLGLEVFAGTTGERAYDNKTGGPIPTPRYHQALENSKVSISLFGAGQDCARFWETLSKGALLVAERPTLNVNSNPVHGRHCLYFRSPLELERIVLRVFNEPLWASDIARLGQEWALTNRSTSQLVGETLSSLPAAATRANGVFRFLWSVVYNLTAALYLWHFKYIRHIPIRYSVLRRGRLVLADYASEDNNHL